jgi:hypothetical protein
MDIKEEGSRLEQILQWDIAYTIISNYKSTFSKGSYYYMICQQIEKMLSDSIDEQSDLIEQETTNAN